jgi:hypothetical protein
MKRIPKEGISGPIALREAAASELGQVIDLVGAAVRPCAATIRAR